MAWFFGTFTKSCETRAPCFEKKQLFFRKSHFVAESARFYTSNWTQHGSSLDVKLPKMPDQFSMCF